MKNILKKFLCAITLLISTIFVCSTTYAADVSYLDLKIKNPENLPAVMRLVSREPRIFGLNFCQQCIAEVRHEDKLLTNFLAAIIPNLKENALWITNGRRQSVGRLICSDDFYDSCRGEYRLRLAYSREANGVPDFLKNPQKADMSVLSTKFDIHIKFMNELMSEFDIIECELVTCEDLRVE